MMWDLDPKWADQEITEALIMSYVQKRGQIFQGNVMDKTTLIKAMENPEENYHIIVRVGGFSARFVNLGRECQTEIINRYDYAG